MEFLLGFVASFVTIFFIKKFILNDELFTKNKLGTIRYTQSYLFDLIAPALPYMPIETSLKPTQSFLNTQKNLQRMIFTDNKAYWIKDNAFYEAYVVDGEVDKNTAKVVDTIAMDKVELDKMVFIVQKLTEGNRNDFGNPGIG